MDTIKTYKRRFDRDLRHIKLILMHERYRMPVHDWLRLVAETKESILKHPDDYFCHPLPPPAVFSATIEKVFEHFLIDQRLLALQKSTAFRIRPSGGK